MERDGVSVDGITDGGVVIGADGVPRCAWCSGHTDYEQYHDHEWGRRPSTDNHWFEKVCLEGFQAGLSWLIVLRRRERLREVFSGFDPDVVALMTNADIDRLVTDPGVIRHRGKLESVVNNARRAQALRDEWGSLAGFFERFAADRPRPVHLTDIPTTSNESHAMSRELRSRGWTFVGPTTMYALSQALGLVDDHLTTCWVARPS